MGCLARKTSFLASLVSRYEIATGTNAFLHTTVRMLVARLVTVSAEALPTDEEDRL